MNPPQWLSPADGWAALEAVVASGAKNVSTINLASDEGACYRRGRKKPSKSHVEIAFLSAAVAFFTIPDEYPV